MYIPLTPKGKEKKQKPDQEEKNAMATKFFIMAFLAILATMTTVTDAQADCATKLTPCFPFIQNATAKPTDACCTPIKDAVANQLTCLCGLYNDPNILPSFNITVADALRVSKECGVNTDLSKCNATATPPTSTPPPPGEPGDADRIALAGMTTLLLFLVSIVLF